MNKMDIIARFLTDNVVWLTIVIAFVSVASYLVGRFSGYLYWLSPGLKKVAIIPQLTPLMAEAFGDKGDKSDNIRKFVFINQLAKQAEKALKADWLAEENERLREQIAELEGKIKSKSEGGHKPPRDMDMNKLRETVLNGSKTPVHELMVKGADPLVLSHDEAVKAGLPFAMEDADLHQPPTLGNPCELTSQEEPVGEPLYGPDLIGAKAKEWVAEILNDGSLSMGTFMMAGKHLIIPDSVPQGVKEAGQGLLHACGELALQLGKWRRESEPPPPVPDVAAVEEDPSKKQ